MWNMQNEWKGTNSVCHEIVIHVIIICCFWNKKLVYLLFLSSLARDI